MRAATQTDREQCVLCAALCDIPSWRAVMTQLSIHDFVEPDHQSVFAALHAVTPVGRKTDIVAVLAGLRAADRSDLVDYVSELIDVTPTFDPLQNWITGMLDQTRRRKTSAALQQAIADVQACEPHDDVELVLERRLSAIRASAPDARVFDDRGAMVAAAMAYLADDSRMGTPYGFSQMDKDVLPAQPGHLVLIGGASGSGKSTVARNLLRNWVQRYTQRVGWLTCEMTGEEQLVHLACIDAQVPIEDYYRRRLPGWQITQFQYALEAWRDTGLLEVNELGAVTPAIALRIFRRWREQGVTHFLLDHLHRLDYGANKSGDDLRVPVAAFARSLKTFAKDTQSVVCALVQYSKIKPSEEPSDDKIREANNILEESDAVFHIYCPLVAHARDSLGGLHPLTKTTTGGRYFEHDAPKDSILSQDEEAVYLKLGKQRRRLKHGVIRIPFNKRLGVLYDTGRTVEDN